MSGNTEQPAGTLEVALAHASRLLQTDASAALEQAGEILKVIPDQPQALALEGLALGRLGRGDEAIERVAPRGATPAHATGRLACARRSLHRARNARGRRWRLRAIHTPLHARPEAHGRGDGAGREPHSRSRSCASRAPEAPSHGCGGHPHAGGSGGAHRPISRRGKPAVAVPRTGARFRGRAPQLRHGAAPAEQARGRARAGGAAARRRAAQSRLSQSQGGHSRAHRRVLGVHRTLSKCAG